CPRHTSTQSARHPCPHRTPSQRLRSVVVEDEAVQAQKRRQWSTSAATSTAVGWASLATPPSACGPAAAPAPPPRPPSRHPRRNRAAAELQSLQLTRAQHAAVQQDVRHRHVGAARSRVRAIHTEKEVRYPV
ncbi:uncharacterized protein Tco025E_08265, partial [Trypanosoma conorhini]